MPRRDWRTCFQDILDAISAIERGTEVHSEKTFESNEQAVHAVLYNLMIIGEAATQIPDDIRSKYPEVEWQRLRETRNFVSHVYFGIDVPRIWGIVRRRLPRVREQLTQILKADQPVDE